MKKVVGVVLGLLPVSVFAECVPVPDCASIGYTETSCEGDSLKCPFDTSKLYCIPCDSSYKYSCSGDNIKNPIGDTCNNKYAACECIAGATFSNGECICNTSCDTVGNIYYSDGTCNSCNITDKTPVGIIAYKDESKHLVLSINMTQMRWSTTQYDENGNITITFDKKLNGTFTYPNSEIATTNYNGKNNTKFIVNTYGENAEGVAAVYCYNYTPEGLESTKNAWYLPSSGEMYNYIQRNKNYIDAGLALLGESKFNTRHYWTACDHSGNSSHAFYLHSEGVIVNNSKEYVYWIRCLLEL